MSPTRLAFEPYARQALRSGFNRLADAMVVALGPRGRLVAFPRANPRRAPELLNDGAAIARRFTGLPNRFETMGALLARHIAWQVEEAVGDGATTAVVIARAVMNEADRYVAAGHNPMRLRRGIEIALAAALCELDRMAKPLDSPAQIRGLATSVIGDDTLGKHVEEVFDVVGPYGAVQVRSHYGRGHAVQYINGTHWNQGWASSYFTTDGGTAVVKDPFLLFTSGHLTVGADLVPVLEQVHQAGGGKRGLVVVAPSIAGDALNVLVTNKERGVLPTLAVKAPGLGPEKNEVLTDLAVMTGGRVFAVEAGDQINQATLDDLGQAAEVRAVRSGFTLTGGRGRPAAIRQRSQELRRRIPQAAYGRDRNRLVERSGKLQGGVALLEVGGATETERDYLKDRVEEAVQVVRLAMQAGIVPGGGAALLACRRAVAELRLADEEAAGAAILAQALAAPLLAMAANAGFEPTPVLFAVGGGPDGCVFDLMAETLTDAWTAGIVDPVKVVQTALQTGVSGALMALTTDVLVHKPRPNRSKEVDFKP